MTGSKTWLAVSLLVLPALFQGIARAGDDPLPSWNDGAVKTTIMTFVERITQQGSPNFVPPDKRIATFDNDGTLWAEQPIYFQVQFALDRVKALAPWFELRVPTGGDTYTLNVGRVAVKPDAATGELYLNDHAASLRAIYDLGDPSRSRVMHSSGQSGLPWSSRYRDFADDWVRVDYVPLWPVAGEAAVAVQRLRPRAP